MPNNIGSRDYRPYAQEEQDRNLQAMLQPMAKGILQQQALSGKEQNAQSLEKLRNMLAGQTTQKNLQDATDLEQKLNKNRSPYGSKASVGINGQGGVNITESEPNAMGILFRQKNSIENGVIKENGEITSAIKNLGIDKMKDRVDAINNAMQNLSLKTNIGDQGAEIRGLMGELGPAATRAFGTVMREHGIPAEDLSGTASEVFNKITSKTDPIYNQNVTKAFQDFLHQQAQAVGQQYGYAKTHLAAALPSMTSFHQQAGVDYNPEVAMYTGPLEDSLAQEGKMYSQLSAPPSATQSFQTPQARNLGDKLGNAIGHPLNALAGLLGLGGSDQSPSPAATAPVPPSPVSNTSPNPTPAPNPTPLANQDPDYQRYQQLLQKKMSQ